MEEAPENGKKSPYSAHANGITLVTPIMKYGSEIINTINKVNLNHLETAQNNALRLICEAVKTTPVTPLQLYTEN